MFVTEDTIIIICALPRPLPNDNDKHPVGPAAVLYHRVLDEYLGSKYRRAEHYNDVQYIHTYIHTYIHSVYMICSISGDNLLF